MNWFARFLDWFKPRPAPTPAPVPTPAPTPGLKYTSQVLPIEPFSASNLAAMHNAERMKARISPLLLLDTRLMAEAEQRAEHAAAVNLDASHLHDGFAPDPGDVTDGENAAKGQADAASVMAGWMDSKGHRDNILAAKFTRIGCGRAITPDNITFWYVRFGG